MSQSIATPIAVRTTILIRECVCGQRKVCGKILKPSFWVWFIRTAEKKMLSTHHAVKSDAYDKEHNSRSNGNDDVFKLHRKNTCSRNQKMKQRFMSQKNENSITRLLNNIFDLKFQTIHAGD